MKLSDLSPFLALKSCSEEEATKLSNLFGTATDTEILAALKLLMHTENERHNKLAESPGCEKHDSEGHLFDDFWPSKFVEDYLDIQGEPFDRWIVDTLYAEMPEDKTDFQWASRTLSSLLAKEWIDEYKASITKG
jgi:hypothetical protein